MDQIARGWNEGHVAPGRNGHAVMRRVQSGITGVWQVVGRNRVTFDEMTFQDLMYDMNTCFWVDLRLCLKTIPAALIGTGL